MSDLISREKLLNEINLLKKSPWYNKDFAAVKLVRKDAVAIVEKCVEEAPGVAEWISVKDKMPEKGTYDRYLVHVENVTNFNRLLDNVIIALWCCDDWLYDGWEDNRVTHWMPLPPKPESENDAE